jgi:hypothetical protein
MLADDVAELVELELAPLRWPNLSGRCGISRGTGIGVRLNNSRCP